MQDKTSNPETQAETTTSRRKFLTNTAAGAAGTAAMAFPMISVAQSPITMRFQSTWPAKDIFHEYALDYAKLVNDMSGGRLKIDVLPAGSARWWHWSSSAFRPPSRNKSIRRF